MAYNILKGTVEGSVDQHGDQKIEGVKVFKSTISASVFYDTDAQSPCATIKDVAITKITGGSKNSILLMGENSQAKTHYDFRFQNDTLIVKNIKAETLKGSAEGLSKIPSNKFVGRIGAGSILFGPGLQDSRGILQVNGADGIKCDEKGVSINVAPHSCLALLNNKLTINPTKTIAINSEGQNLSDNDLLMVYDASRNRITNTALNNLFDSYINKKIPHPQGAAGSIQIKGRNGFVGVESLTYHQQSDTLNLDGRIVADNIVSQAKAINEGAVHCNIIKTEAKNYNINSTDYTVICDASKNVVNVKLPPAQNHTGRILVIKKSNTDKYKINSNVVNVLCDEGRIDINNKIEIKMNFSTRTVQSDGENWWIIGSKGS